ncbi:MAG: SDR family oxidoreductase [Acidimicrobiales bacterium]|nr:SDR family oxidoreductase [Acidimicrobiales bacterium]
MQDPAAFEGFSATAARLVGKVAVVVGGGQTPGETIGNGRATAVLLARHGASVLVVDSDQQRALGTARQIAAEGGTASTFVADITVEEQCRALVQTAVDRYGRLDCLHNNVGMSLAAGDAVPTELTEDAFDRLVDINLKGMWLTCKHAVPVMRAQGSGSIVNISSMAAWATYPYFGYKATKAAVIALTEQLAAGEAAHNIRANVILPGLMNTPMAIESRVAAGTPREQVVAERDRQVPLGRRMGSAWDVAAAALFLHSEEARFITGVALPVDGGASVRRG